MSGWPCPVAAGDRIEAPLRLDEAGIVAGAAALGDFNPLHHDRGVAARSRFGSLIASGPHVSGQHMCLIPTHLAGRGIVAVGLEFTTRWRRPVLPGVDYLMWWEFTETTPRGPNWYAELHGAVSADGDPAVIGRGSILLLAPED